MLAPHGAGNKVHKMWQVQSRVWHNPQLSCPIAFVNFANVTGSTIVIKKYCRNKFQH
jgi:hypothetical protein